MENMSLMLEEWLARIDGLRVGVIGDFCLDAYWHADMRKSELSRETPHYPLPIVKERLQPGGAGNVACNLAALKPSSVSAITVLGEDWRGAALLSLLRESSIDVRGCLRSAERVTNAYIKPMRHGISETVYEDPRLDFENHAPLSQEWEERLLDALNHIAPSLDVLCVCDQMQMGCVTPKIRDRICQLGAEGLQVWVDSRDRIALFQHVIAKPNEVELCRAMERPLTTEVTKLADYAKCLQAQTQQPLLVTLGDRGCMVLEKGECKRVPACPVEPPVDICGAGDTFLSAASLFFAAGASLTHAAFYAACSASLTVKKLAMTGSTSREELRARVNEVAESPKS